MLKIWHRAQVWTSCEEVWRKRWLGVVLRTCIEQMQVKHIDFTDDRSHYGWNRRYHWKLWPPRTQGKVSSFVPFSIFTVIFQSANLHGLHSCLRQGKTVVVRALMKSHPNYRFWILVYLNMWSMACRELWSVQLVDFPAWMLPHQKPYSSLTTVEGVPMHSPSVRRSCKAAFCG